MKKISTAAAKQSKNFSEQKLTIGLDLGDRSSWYCVLEEAGEVLLERNWAQLRRRCGRCSGRCRAVGSRWKRERIRRGSVDY
jgi:hypothetical protein